jgi:hypothetical protein
MVVDTKFNDDSNLNMNGVIFLKNKLDIEFGVHEFMYIFSSGTYMYAKFQIFLKKLYSLHILIVVTIDFLSYI